MNFTKQDLDALFHHARTCIVSITQNLVMGMRPELAAAFALQSLNTWRVASTPAKERDPLERRKMRIGQALQIAINFYQTPETIEVLGAESAERLRHEFLQILLEETGN